MFMFFWVGQVFLQFQLLFVLDLSVWYFLVLQILYGLNYGLVFIIIRKYIEIQLCNKDLVSIYYMLDSI